MESTSAETAAVDGVPVGVAVGGDEAVRVGLDSSEVQAAGARGPLQGLRVFDFTSYWAGPCATQVLAWFGADVVKVESVQRPDGTRMGSAYATSGDRPWELAPLFHGTNTGKRGVTVDLGRPEGVELARRLLGVCDIFVENYSPRVVERFGLLPDDGARPDLIVARMPAWGLSGPWREQPGFAQNMEQATGLAYITGHPDARPVVPRGVCDPLGGLHAAFAILAAVRLRRSTGRGQHIEAPLVDAALNVAAGQVIGWTAHGELAERRGNRSAAAAPQGVYPCGPDGGFLALSVETDAQWRRLTDLLGHPVWAAPGDLADAAARHRRHDRLDDWLRTRLGDAPDRLALVERLLAHGVPAADVVAAEHVQDHPQFAARGFFQEIDHEVAGRLAIPLFPARWQNGASPAHSRPAPGLGEHNQEIFGDLLGLTPAELATLEATHIIGTQPATH
ncbi:MAG: CoA transferase [Streptomycetaceae bacterium]|nr:CoA transferase [Streptomycetaceae bacterium]